MNEKKQTGIHIREKNIHVDEIVAVDLVKGLHHNSFHNHSQAWELMYCLEGKMVMRLGDDWIDMDEGCCMLIPPEKFHSSVTESDKTKCLFFAFASPDDLSLISERVIRFSEQQASGFRLLEETLTVGYLNIDHTESVMTLIPNADLPIGAEQMALNYLELLLVLMLRDSDSSQVRTRTHTDYVNDFSSNYITDSVTTYIREHVTEHITVESIADHFGYSRSRLSTIYKENTGRGLKDAIGFEKMLRARQLLIESDLSVSEISNLLCYSSPQYFTNKFTRSSGMSPSNYARFKRTKVN